MEQQLLSGVSLAGLQEEVAGKVQAAVEIKLSLQTHSAKISPLFIRKRWLCHPLSKHPVFSFFYWKKKSRTQQYQKG